jgi:putative modified peptide
MTVANKLSDRTVDALLDKLSSDDAFRERFQQNPREATRSLGTDDPAIDSLPEKALPGLADKQAVGRSRDAMRKQLVESAYPFQPITLDVPER